MNIPDKARTFVESLTGLTIESFQSIGGGSIANAFAITLATGENVFIKFSLDMPEAFFESEAVGLALLQKCTSLVVPQVLGTFSDHGCVGVVLEYVNVAFSGSAPAGELARGLVELHQTTDAMYGFESDNFIGSTPQINTPDSDWGRFFVERRLRFQIDRGSEKGWLPGTTQETFNACTEKLQSILNEPGEPPVVLHGDLWSGNVLATDRGACLIDPAVYYGSREVDIAFTEFFGGFGQEFYREYERLLPIKPGAEKRKEIYNLYHLLNHANMFGGHYVQHALSKITDLAAY